jgi:hypothetical protein
MPILMLYLSILDRGSYDCFVSSYAGLKLFVNFKLGLDKAKQC